MEDFDFADILDHAIIQLVGAAAVMFILGMVVSWLIWG